MPPAQWRRALVLGGIRSGKSEYAEAMVAHFPVIRYIATARRGPGDGEWAARIDSHRARRPSSWITHELGDDPSALIDILGRAGPEETLLLDDLGTWVAALTQDGPAPRLAAALGPALDEMIAALRGCPARVVLVSPEVGLSVVPPTEAGREFADALGRTNRAVAAVCDRVVLVVAGNAVPVKGGP